MELFRALKNKKLMAAVIALLLLNCVSFFITQQRDIADSGISISTYSAVFKENAHIFSKKDFEKQIKEKSNRFLTLKGFADADSVKTENAEEYEIFAEEKANLIRENPKLYEEYKTCSYTYEELTALSAFYSHFASQLAYQDSYPTYIDSVIARGDELTSKKLFSDTNSFSYKSIQKSTEDFAKNKNLSLSPANDLPVSAVLNYQNGNIILILICVFTAISFVSDRNVNALINTCKNGRKILKLKQLSILILFSFFCSFIVYISEIIISLEIYNAPVNSYAPIQSSEIFSDCILHINFLQLFAIHIVFKAIIAVMISLVIWLLISLSNNIIAVSGIAGVITAAELLLYKNISAQSNLSFFKTFNVFSLFDYKAITEYNLISLFSVPVRSDIIVWAIVLLIAFSVSVSIILSAEHNYPIKSPNRAFRTLHILFNKLSGFYTRLQCLFYTKRFETFKIMHIGKGLLVVMVFLLITGFNFNTNPIVFSPTEIFLNDYYDEYGGELNASVYSSIDKMRAELTAIDREFEFKSKQYGSGKISLDEYELARAKTHAYDTQRKAVDELTQQVSRIEALADKGIKPVLINEAGYNCLFFRESNQNKILLLTCAALLLFSSVFSVEKTSNMLALNHCSKNGRGQLYLKKLISVIPKTFLLTLLSYTILILQNAYLYGLTDISCDIHNLQCLSEIGFNISIIGYIALNFVFEFLLVTAVSLAVAALSAFMPQLAVIILSAALFLLPGALYMISVYAAKEIAVSYLFNLNALLLDKGLSMDSFILQLILILLCAVLLYLCRRKWCLTKDR